MSSHCETLFIISLFLNTLYHAMRGMSTPNLKIFLLIIHAMRGRIIISEVIHEMRPEEIRKLSGLSQRAFSAKYGIPTRTIEDWETGKRNAPDYVLAMLERIVREDFNCPKEKNIDN